MDIFVGSLPFKLTEAGLREVFEKYGEVTSVKIIIDKITRQNKGFGFVEMPDEEQATQAIAALNGTEIMGRPIVVNKSQDKKDAPRRNNFNSGGNSEGRYSGGYGKEDNRKRDFNDRNSGKGGDYNQGGQGGSGKKGGGWKDDY
jgi:RNA recognition motif-containing protein